MRLFLDTNVIIIGAASQNNPNATILDWVGFSDGNKKNDVQLILSTVLQYEISRVAKRLRNKDWAGQIITRLWQNCDLIVVAYEPDEATILKWSERIPREDVGIYLTAVSGNAQHFVSANHELIRALVKETGAFQCHTPQQFVDKFIAPNKTI